MFVKFDPEMLNDCSADGPVADNVVEVSEGSGVTVIAGPQDMV